LDYFKDAFGGFAPHIDNDAAVKFALNMILMDRMLSELEALLTDGHDIGGIEGEPGWMLERRDASKMGNAQGYEHWPVGASFLAAVDVTAYELAHPEFYMDKATFCSYVSKAIDVYRGRYPEDTKFFGIIKKLEQ